MQILKTFFTSTLLAAGLCAHVQAQQNISPKDKLQNWYQKDLGVDSFYGISLDQAYAFLKNKKSKPVIVAIIDAGIDTSHQDLKSLIWTNKKEIPGNGIDDDKNGFVDDVHGWNFLGNPNGQNIDKAPLEKLRVYYKYKSTYEGKNIDTATLSPKEKFEYRMWQRAAGDFANPAKIAETRQEVAMLEMMQTQLHKADSVLQAGIGKPTYTMEDLEAFKTSDETIGRAKNALLRIGQLIDGGATLTNTTIFKELNGEYQTKKGELEGINNPPADVRAQIVKDDYTEFNDLKYGNNDINGPDPMHGTHVAGIIGAIRNNGIGIDGIADNVQLMVIRAVPDGDEYDKDIAHAIRYAVDNGAKVINMSFGKAFSPEKYWVDSAYAYAAQKDVLLVHAAGNEGDNIDTAYNYPSGQLEFYNNITAPNLITVGASGDTHIGNGNLVAGFSNYGKKNVDVFAPGVKIYSTVPVNQYAYLQGTSMASPVVAGLAALIRCYFPKLTAVQVKKVIESSVFKPATADISIPGDSGAKVSLSDISVTGGIINAFNAVKLAADTETVPAKKKKK